MNKKVFGYIFAAALVGVLIVIMLKDAIAAPESDLTEGELGKDVTVQTEDGKQEEDKAEDGLKEGLAKGNLAPDFTLTTLNGEEISLSDYKGKKVILNFWASWCGPCKAEMPYMQKYYENTAEAENVEILAVNLTAAERNGFDKVGQFVEEYGLTFPIPLDEEGSIMKLYRAVSIPTTYMIDTKGIVQNKIIGPMDEKMMQRYIENMN